ncbi:winged helix-turn-helix transcriptional regulator [Massilia sp. RP-1-19]|uniref:Winged helix-turn-helix transcriptional regulator n=1 Tax=Massilia polaris TaxID=2728846 RepID=A0A848HPL7_9BURK|nr:MarR family winged helix-turn-helix transcriptional regulator [Massilia polaris]NML62947.1 winged helix-turn-helix transcriptional regulator [Massilia polaris]
MDTVDRVDLCNYFASRKAARLITKLYEQHLAPSELTSPQFSLLAHLDEIGQALIRELVDVLATERSSIVRALQPLEREGLVKHGADTQGTRRNIVSLTKKGRIA